MRRAVPKTLVAIPVYNEQKYVTRVLDEVRKYARDILVVDDGSTDDTPVLLAQQPVEVVRHATNRGYGQSMIDAFRWARCYEYDWLITMDCDEQHEPASLPDFYEAIAAGGADVVSGSRYLSNGLPSDMPPSDRRAINREVTQWVNCCLSVPITDAFCGFKAYRVEALRKLRFSERGYAFPLQFWVQAAALGLRVVEVPIRLIYNDPNRSFGGKLDDPQHRLAHYRQIFEQEIAKFPTLVPAMEEVEPCSCCCESTSQSCEPAAGCTGPVGVDDEGK
ncbi:MAG: glycosyltransferase family 2 protein [Phycisphaeraceae bacterium]|nr:glycosyltransferase family 2 protein [Phycisphaeraceae bacterium]